VVYAGTSHGVFKTSDGGINWKPASGVPGDAVTSIAVDPNNNNVVYACLSEGLYQSTDAGATWKSLLTVPVLSVAVATNKPGFVYVGRASAPMMRSTDGGVSWQPTSPEFTVNAIAIDPTNAFNVYAATSRTGFVVSLDGGATWTISNTGITTGATPLNV
jgi:photosystem II stability/assembly factor-like uncharacterized protein